MRNGQEKASSIASHIESQLMDRYGPILTGDALRKSLGFSSMAALRQATSRNKMPIPVFRLKDRKGVFALTTDIALWLAEQRNRMIDQDAI